MGRRANTTGSVWRDRTHGRWAYTYTDAQGRRLTRTRKAWTKRDAQDALDAARGARVRPARAPLVRDYLEDWLRDVQPTVRASSHRRYTQLVRLASQPLGHIPLDKLTPPLCQAAWTALLASGRAPSTVRGVRTVLSIALRRAEDWELVARNPVPRTTPPRLPETSRPAVTVETARRILASVAGTRLALPVTIALVYGLRVSEVCGLSWPDVTEDGIAVRGQLAEDRSGIVPPKTRSSLRTLPLVPLVVDELARTPRARAYLCLQSDGRPWTRRTLSSAWYQHRRAAGLPALRFHDLRHAAASLLGGLGVPLKVSMAVLGHNTIATHMEYHHLAPGVIQGALLELSAALAGDDREQLSDNHPTG